MQEAEQFKGRLGFKSRSDTLLNQGLVQAVDMLDDYGHPPTQINSRASGRIELESDQYHVVLRLRRLPLRMGVQLPEGIPAPAIFLDVAITRLHPQASDQEITELLLAVLLRRLTEALSPSVVFWQDAPIAMSRGDFLGIFQLAEQPIADNQQRTTETDARISAPTTLSRPAAIRTGHSPAKPRKHPVATEPPQALSPFKTPDRLRTSLKLFPETGQEERQSQPRAHAKDCFAAVDDMADDLERKCNRRITRAAAPGDQVIDLSALRLPAEPWERQNIMGWAATGLIAMLSAPIAVLLLLVELMRGSRLKPRTQLLTAAVFVSLLQGTGMVQAAARAFWLPPN